MFADSEFEWIHIPLFICSASLFVLIVWGILKGYRSFSSAAEATQRRAYEGLTTVQWEPGPGLVKVVYHTYYGVIAWVTQTEHCFWASPEEARVALNRLLRSTLLWGLLAYGFLFVPILAFGNWFDQRLSIRKQERALLGK